MCSLMNRQRCCYNTESRLPRVFLSVVKSIFYLSTITTFLFGDMVHHQPRLYMLDERCLICSRNFYRFYHRQNIHATI